MVEQDADNWLRFEVYHDGSRLNAFGASTTDGASTAKFNTGPVWAGPNFMRVTRAGDTWTLTLSGDGQSWVNAGSFSRALSVATVGPFAGNHGTSLAIPQFTARFDYVFNTASPIADEDGGQPAAQATLDVQTTGQGSVAVDPAPGPYALGTQVTLTPTPAQGWTFTGWSGALSGSDDPAQLTLDADAQVTATFTQQDPDPTPPVITGVDASATHDRATITWTTDVPASSAVAYGPTTDYESGTVDDAALVQDHSVQLTGLEPETTYHYRPSSTDADGESTDGPDATFTTSAAPPPDPAPGGPFVSDDFNTAELSQEWTVIDPVGDGAVGVTGEGTGDAVLELSVPAGVSHDPWGVNRALRVVQDVDDTDFQIEAALASTPSSRYQMQGLMVEQDADNWLRFEVYHDGSRLNAFGASTTDGASTAKFNTALSGPAPGFMRVTRAGDTWTLTLSGDGQSWVNAGSFSRALSVATVGPFAGNHGASLAIPQFTARFDYVFNTASPIADEDGGQPPAQATLDVQTTGQGSVAVDPAPGPYALGTPVTLTPTPAQGWTFTGWSGALSGSEDPAQLTLDADAQVTATFTQQDPDPTPPAITGVDVSATHDGATVTWTTDVPASSTVAYGPTTAYESGHGRRRRAGARPQPAAHRPRARDHVPLPPLLDRRRRRVDRRARRHLHHERPRPRPPRPRWMSRPPGRAALPSTRRPVPTRLAPG